MTELRLITAFALMAAATTLSGCNPFESKMVGACEEVLKKRLKSPSSYARIDLRESRRDVPLDEYKAAELAMVAKVYSNPETAAIERARIDRDIERFQKSKTFPVEFEKTIEYDAANSYGALLRDISRCTYVSDTADESQASTLSVIVDGDSWIDWIGKGIPATP